MGLWTSGVEMQPLPDALVLRRLLKADLGDGYDMKAAFEWWTKNKERHFPLRTSKLRRVVDSLFSQPATKLLPAVQHHVALWSFTHVDHGFELSSFTFTSRGR